MNAQILTRVTDKTPAEYADRYDIYKRIGSSEFSKETSYIHREHSYELKFGFENNDKSKYQDDKKARLKAVIFSINDFNKGAELKELPEVVVGDIDKDPKDKLDHFRVEIAPTLPYIEACARSVSGIETGASWFTARIEKTEDIEDIPSELKHLLAWTWKYSKTEKIKAVYKAFYALVCHKMKEYDITVDPSQDDVNRKRYLTHAHYIHINTEATALTFDELISFLKRDKKRDKKRQKKVHREKKRIRNTHLKDAKPAIQTAHRKTKEAKTNGELKFPGGYKEGQRHLFVNYFAILCNQYGVSEKECTDYALKKWGFDGSTNAISYPYGAYYKDHGSRAHDIINPVIQEYDLKGRYLDSFSDTIYSAIKKNKRVSISAPKGSGKSFAFTKKIAPKLTFNGDKCLVVYPINAKVEQDAHNRQLEYITGERISESKAILKQIIDENDIILVNQDQLPRCTQYMRMNDMDYHLIIDESHTLISGSETLFRAKQRYNVYKMMSQAKTCTLLSGTMKPYFIDEGFYPLKFTNSKASKFKVRICKRGKNIEHTVFKHIQRHGLDNDKILIFRVLDKNKIKEIQEYLIQCGLKKKNIAVIHSDNKESKAYRRLLTTKDGGESFSADTQVVLTTSILDSAIDIHSARDIIPIDVKPKASIDIDTFLQFIHRHRIKGEREAFLYYYDNDNDSKIYDALKEYRKVKKIYQDKIIPSFQDLTDSADIDPVTSEILQNDLFENSKFLTIDEETKEVGLNAFSLMNEIEKQRIKFTNITQAERYINQNYTYIQVIREDQLPDLEDQDKEKLKAIKDKRKEERKAIREKVKELYTNDPETMIGAVGLKTEDDKLKKRIDYSKVNFKRAQEISDKYPEVITSAYAERIAKRHIEKEKLGLILNDKQMNMIFSNTGWRLLIQKYKILLSLKLHDTDQLDQIDPMMKSDIRGLVDLRASFAKEEGEKLTGEDIANRVNAQRKIDLSDRKAIEIFSMICEKYRGKHDKYYKIGKVRYFESEFEVKGGHLQKILQRGALTKENNIKYKTLCKRPFLL